MEQKSSISWLVKCALSAAAVFAACGLATVWIGKGLQIPATTTRDGTLITLSRYVREPVPDVVLVGSSITYRLSEQYFATAKLRNLALAGGSPLTGLEVVLSQPRLPKIILIETNLLWRPADDAVAARFSQGQNAEPRFLRPIRAAVAAYENWLHAPLSHAQVLAAMDALLERPPADFDNRIYLERIVRQLDEDPTDAIQPNVERLAAQVEKAQRLGARVMLFEMPLPREIGAARNVEINRSLVHARFADPAQWLPIDVETGELRWLDGAHLDDRSAMLVARSIDAAVGQILLPKS